MTRISSHGSECCCNYCDINDVDVEERTMSQKAIYQERARLCLEAAQKADEVAAELYAQIQAEGETPDPVVHDHWLEMVSASAFWTGEWLSYLDMIAHLEQKGGEE